MSPRKATPIPIEVAVQILQKRADWLAKRTATAEAEGRVLAHDRLELMALETVITTLDAQHGGAPAA